MIRDLAGKMKQYMGGKGQDESDASHDDKEADTTIGTTENDSDPSYTSINTIPDETYGAVSDDIQDYAEEISDSSGVDLERLLEAATNIPEQLEDESDEKFEWRQRMAIQAKGRELEKELSDNKSEYTAGSKNLHSSNSKASADIKTFLPQSIYQRPQTPQSGDGRSESEETLQSSSPNGGSSSSRDMRLPKGSGGYNELDDVIVAPRRGRRGGTSSFGGGSGPARFTVGI